MQGALDDGSAWVALITSLDLFSLQCLSRSHTIQVRICSVRHGLGDMGSIPANLASSYTGEPIEMRSPLVVANKARPKVRPLDHAKCSIWTES